MKSKNILLGLMAIAAIALVSCNQGGVNPKSVKIKTEADSVSYALGHSIGNSLKSQFPNANPVVIAKGIAEAYEGKEDVLFKDPMAADQFIRAYMQKEQQKIAEENKAAGEKFLEENKKKAGINVTASGLQYEVIKEGQGEKPTAENVVKVHYHGTMLDGTVFDSSVDRGEPATFPLNGVIEGWIEGLQLMTVGSKYKFYIPAELAYGPQQMPGGVIKPNSTLIFEVELLEIVKE